MAFSVAMTVWPYKIVYHSPLSFSASRASTNLLGMGTPMEAAFSSMLSPSLAMKNMITTVRKSGSCNHNPKSKKYRSAVIPTEILPLLRSWIMSLPEDCQWLFPGQKEGHLTARRVRQIVHQAADKAGIQRIYAHDKNKRPLNVVSPHSLRHAHAVTALDAGVPLNDLLAQLGHSNLATTSVYLNVNLEHRKRSYERVRFGVEW